MEKKYHYPRPQLYRESFQSLDGTWILNQKPIQVSLPTSSFIILL